MVGKTPRARKNEKQRMEVIHQYCGCLPCLLMGHFDRHTTIEHVTERGRRVGEGAEQHANTIGLCTWHHFGRGPRSQFDEIGPSLAHGRRLFEDYFGDEVHVLIPVQDYLLELFAADPWPEYTVTAQAAMLTRTRWIELNANARSPSSPRNESG